MKETTKNTKNKKNTKKHLEPEGLLRTTAGGVQIKVFVLPRSSQSTIVGVHEGMLKLKLTKPPVDGQANAECCQVVAKHLGIPKSRVTVTQGHKNRRKVLLVQGVAQDEIKKVLRKLAGELISC